MITKNFPTNDRRAEGILMFERFTDRARRVVIIAQEEAARSGSAEIETDHLLVGLILEGESLAAQVLARLNVHLRTIRRPASAIPLRVNSVTFSDTTKRVFELGLREALQLGHNYIAPEHLLLAIVREGKNLAAKALDDRDVRSEVIAAIAGWRRPASDSVTASRARAGSRWFVDTFTRWSFLLDETRGTAMTLVGDFAHRTRMIADLVGPDRVTVDATGLGLAVAEMLTDAGVDVVRVTRTALPDRRERDHDVAQ